VIAVDDYRHHRASREIIIVPVPYAVPAPVVEAPEPLEIGSPKIGRIMRPRYPAQPDRPAPWKPAQHPPRRISKAERLARFLDAIARQDNEIKAYMAEARRRTVLV
jgi:hypothetical protein